MTSFFPATQRAFTRQALLVRDVIEANPGAAEPTRLDGWTTSVLIGHLAAGLEAIWRWGAEDPANATQVDEVAYWTLAGAVATTSSDWALGFAASRAVAELRDLLRSDVERAIELVQASGGNEVIMPPGGGVWITMDAFVQTRVIELTVHGFDLQHAFGAPPTADETALSITAVTLDRRLGGPRPPDLGDPIDWVEVACGRRAHPDPRMPVLG